MQRQIKYLRFIYNLYTITSLKLLLYLFFLFLENSLCAGNGSYGLCHNFEVAQ